MDDNISFAASESDTDLEEDEIQIEINDTVIAATIEDQETIFGVVQWFQPVAYGYNCGVEWKIQPNHTHKYMLRMRFGTIIISFNN